MRRLVFPAAVAAEAQEVAVPLGKFREKVMKKLNLIMVSLLMIFNAENLYAQSNSGSGGLTKTIGFAQGALSLGMGGMLMKSNCPGNNNPALCMMGATAVLSAGSLFASSTSGAKAKKGFSSSGADDFDFDTDLDPSVRNALGELGIRDESGLERGLANWTKEVQKQKMKLNPDGTVSTPKGTFPGSAFGSGKAMADAGLASPEDIPAIDKALNEMRDKFKVVSIGVGGGGGGGSSMGKSASYSYDDPYKNLYGNMGGEKPNAPRTSGLTRTLASGESIGSQSDNIFEMIRRRYQQKSEEKIFVGQEPVGQ